MNTSAPPKVSPTLLKNPIHLLSLGFGSGLAPKAPGTFGTLVAVPLCLLLQPLGAHVYVLVALAAGLVGIWLCQMTADRLGVHDHPAIVWDEIAGYLLAMAWLPPTWFNLIAAFVLFRYFDIMKPSIIGWCDKNLHGGLGIMADDLLAGVASALVLHAGHALANAFL